MADTNTGPNNCDLMVRNAYVITMNPEREVFACGAVAIQGNNIVAAGPQSEVLERYRARREIDARGAVVHPGFVDGHYHIGVHLSRGALSDDPSKPPRGDGKAPSTFARWFNALTDEDELVSTQLAATEMLRCGITCFMEAGTALEPDAVAAGAETAGIRALVSDPYLWDVVGVEQSASEIKRAPADTERCLRILGDELGRNKDPNALVQGHIALYGIGSVSDELQLAAKQMADEQGVVVAQHIAFLPGDTEAEDKRLGRHAVCHLHDLGVLGANTTLVHANVLRDDEVEPVVSTNTAIVWHPANYMFYSVATNIGYRLSELNKRGVPMGFGTDVAKSWGFGEGPFVAYLLARNTGDYLSADNLLEMMTVGGARAVGLSDRVGSLEVGKRADMVMRNPDLPESQPGFDPVQDMMLVSRSRSVDTVICNGDIVIQGGRSTRLDEHSLAVRARRTAIRLAGVVGLEPPRPLTLRSNP